MNLLATVGLELSIKSWCLCGCVAVCVCPQRRSRSPINQVTTQKSAQCTLAQPSSLDTGHYTLIITEHGRSFAFEEDFGVGQVS